MRPIINSEKRIVQLTLSTVMVGDTLGINLVAAVQDPGATNPLQVAAGTVVKAVYLEYWLLGTSAQPPTVTTVIEKSVSGSSSITSSEMTNINAYSNKKNILEMHQGIIGDANSNPIPFYRGWLKIPKGKQRFGLGDTLTFSVKSITEETQLCGLCIFKAYN